MMKLINFLFALHLAANVSAQTGKGTWDVFGLGAKGDGQTMDTRAIQKAIDQCHAAGGGKVYLHNGRFLSGTLYLKSNVTLHIEAGAVLLGSDNADDYPNAASVYPTYVSDTMTSKAFIYAENVKNIAIEGRGTIDGRGDLIDKRGLKDAYLFPSFMYRPRIIHIRGSEKVRVKDITLFNSGSWVQTYQQCTDLIIDGITVDSRENKDVEQKDREHTARHRNTDGLDLVDCEKVRISNCMINSGDDAICLKSFSPDKACRDITISDCIVSAGASGIKIGTETAGAFEDITVQNCVVYDTWGEGIAIMTADGARIERVNISGISLRNIKRSGIFIRLNTRNRTYGGNTIVNKPHLRDIIIENIQGSRLASLGCSITGIEGLPLENIVLTNINLTFEGGVKSATGTSEIPEKQNAYPAGAMFGPALPAYGFFIRHVNGITLDNIHLKFSREDTRPAIACSNTGGLVIRQLKAQGTAATKALIQLENTENIVISESRSLSPIPVFASVEGAGSRNLVLMNNDLSNSKQKVFFSDPAAKASLKEFNNIE